MKRRYWFVVCLTGTGKNKAEAWQTAVEGFSENPGDPPAHRKKAEILPYLQTDETDRKHDLEGFYSEKAE